MAMRTLDSTQSYLNVAKPVDVPMRSSQPFKQELDVAVKQRIADVVHRLESS